MAKDEISREESGDSLPGCAAPDDGDLPSRQARRGPLTFVIVFITIVIAALSGYHFAIHTKANDYYLYVLARQTAWVLSLVAESCEVESGIGFNHDPKRIRAAIAAWEAGSDAPDKAAIDTVSDAPLTRWERWRYKALERRRRGVQGELGPNVQLVLRPDLNIKLRTAREKLESLEANERLAPDEKSRLIREQETAVAALQTESRALLRQPLADRKTGYVFSFSLVPSCGAVEVISIFFAAVLAFPASWRKRLWGLALGLPVLYAVNILRIAFLAIVGALDSYERVWFDFLHEYVWQAVYIIFVVAAWLAWVEYFVRRTR